MANGHWAVAGIGLLALALGAPASARAQPAEARVATLSDYRDGGLEPPPARLTKIVDRAGAIVGRQTEQPGLGICGPVSAAATLDGAYCASHGLDARACAALPEGKRASRLDLSRLGANLPPSRLSADGNQILSIDRGDSKSYEGLVEGGDALRVLRATTSWGATWTSEACAPSSQVLSPAGSKSYEARAAYQIESFRMLKQANERARARFVAAGCADADRACRAKAVGDELGPLAARFAFKAPREQLERAMVAPSYPQALDLALVPEACWGERERIEAPRGWEARAWPLMNAELKRASRDTMVAKLWELLRRGRPAAVSLCFEPGWTKARPLAECKSGHALVIAEIAKACDPKASGEGACEDILRVENSWGPEFQRAFSGGWVRAQPLLDRSSYDKASLSWIQPKGEDLDSIPAPSPSR